VTRKGTEVHWKGRAFCGRGGKVPSRGMLELGTRARGSRVIPERGWSCCFSLPRGPLI